MCRAWKRFRSAAWSWEEDFLRKRDDGQWCFSQDLYAGLQGPHHDIWVKERVLDNWLTSIMSTASVLMMPVYMICHQGMPFCTILCTCAGSVIRCSTSCSKSPVAVRPLAEALAARGQRAPLALHSSYCQICHVRYSIVTMKSLPWTQPCPAL